MRRSVIICVQLDCALCPQTCVENDRLFVGEADGGGGGGDAAQHGDGTIAVQVQLRGRVLPGQGED